MKKKRLRLLLQTECKWPLESIDESANGGCLGCSTEDEKDYTLSQADGRADSIFSVGERFLIEPLNTFKGVGHVLSSNGQLKHFTAMLTQPYHRLYTSLFIDPKRSADRTSFGCTLRKNYRKVYFYKSYLFK